MQVLSCLQILINYMYHIYTHIAHKWLNRKCQKMYCAQSCMHHDTNVKNANLKYDWWLIFMAFQWTSILLTTCKDQSVFVAAGFINFKYCVSNCFLYFLMPLRWLKNIYWYIYSGFFSWKYMVKIAYPMRNCLTPNQ